VPLAVVIVGIIYYSQHYANQATFESLQSIKDNSQHKSIADKIDHHLQLIEKQVYRHTVYQDKDSRRIIDKELSRLKQLLDEISQHLNNSHADTHDTGFEKQEDIVSLLKITVRKIETYIKYYYNVIDDVNLRFPGMTVLLNELLVHNMNFLQATDEALIDFQQTSDVHRDREAEQLFIKSRYAWVQQVSWFRLFVANRSGIFGAPEKSMKLNLQNRQIYMQQVGEYLKRLKQMDDKDRLDVQASLSLNVMNDAYDEYEKYFVKAREIYASDEWRADYPFLKDLVQPAFKKAADFLNQYKAQIENARSKMLENSYQIAERITISLWLVALVVLLVMVVAYLMFENLLRKPIQQIATALDAEARGESFTPIMNTKTQETQVLIDAFRNMQEQVHSRQSRLTSILENAGEGIITIDDQGVIESFNAAAEKLFDYDDVEVIGKSMSLLIPESYRSGHDELFRQSIKKYEGEKLNLELEVKAQKKSGEVFPISIKISSLVVGGKSLYTAIVEDISERKAMIENLRRLAEHDSLTGLHNRFYFTEELERVVNRIHRDQGGQDALLYIDLDNFKYTNDTLGHLAGDYLLIEVTELLNDRTRKSDLLARIGGDEFGVLLYDVNERIAMKVANQYRQKLQDYIFRYEGKVVDVGCSIGVAMLDHDIKTKDDILSRADFSCHMAKLEGRNKVHLYTDKDKEQIDILSDDISWTRRIKKSLEENRFIIAKQPIAESRGQNCNKYELLLRMVDENGKLIMPSGFIQPAERFGLMVEVDKWVIMQAVMMLEEEAKHTPDTSYSVNLSVQSFESDDIVDIIASEIKSRNINPSALTFEITETVAMADIGLAVKFLDKLRKLGCETALDDFGVGYSSFAYLKDLPVDYVKIDGSFVRDIEHNPLNKTILKSLNDVAQAMGKKTVAEFVETEEIVRMLDLMGVDYVQGFHIGKPEIPASEYQRLGLARPEVELKVVS
jgi:diguanylate cyclase (GGDEF)-like protein/PAS domain S-box-containing protein